MNTKRMEKHERAGTDGKHEKSAKGNMGTVKRVISGKRVVGSLDECGGRQGSKGLSGADPN